MGQNFSVQPQRPPVRRLPHAAQREGARTTSFPLAAPARTISQVATAAEADGST